MLRTYNYEIGDYIKYQGNLSTTVEVLRNPDIGKIEEFGNNVAGQERVYLYLLKAKKNIWCDFRDIRPIYTELVHLRALNFQAIDVNGRKKYELGAVTISGTVIRTPQTTYLLQYCIGDFTNGIPNIESYFDNGELNLQRFFDDYPDVTNLNDLLIFLENQGRQIDKEQVVCS